MSPPSDDKKGQQQEKQEKEKELKLSVEEVGGVCPNPASHQEAQDRECKAIMFMPVVELDDVVAKIRFTLFFLCGTAQEIEIQIKRIKEYGKKKQPREILIPFLGDSPDGDNYTFQVPFCGQGNATFKVAVIVDGKKCWCHFDTKDLVLIADILRRSENCLLQPEHKMWLHDPDDNLPASITFFLHCKKSFEMRTPSNFELVITVNDERGMEISGHSTHKLYSACFFDCPEDRPKSLKAGNPYEKKILEDNHEKICEELKNELSVIGWFVTNGNLDERFIEDIKPLTQERKGEILKHLYQIDNIFCLFIEALQTAGGNEELVNFLLQCSLSLENQNSCL